MGYGLNTFIGLLFLVAIVGFVWVELVREQETNNAPQSCTTEALICPDGTAVGRTGPECAFAPCPTEEVGPGAGDIESQIVEHRDRIIVEAPGLHERISSPLTVDGRARGTWYFEGSFPVIVVDWDGRIIGEGFVTAEGEWMTEDFVPFSGTISFTLPEDTPYDRGSIIFRKDNPSGLPEHDDALEIPVIFSRS